jgi:hypothetical protein
VINISAPTTSVPAASWSSVLVDAKRRGELEVIKKRWALLHGF